MQKETQAQKEKFERMRKPPEMVSITIPLDIEALNNGVGNDPMRCPVALAVNAATGFDVSANENTITLIKNGKAIYQVETPAEVAEFIKDFDDRDSDTELDSEEEELEEDFDSLDEDGNLGSFEFDIEIPKWVADEIRQ